MKGLLAELETASKLFDDQNRDCRLTWSTTRILLNEETGKL
jgi:hypothetical protein